MTKHIHVHLHHTADAGTSEGARKAAQTRKAHSGGVKPEPAQYEHPGVARILKSDAPDHLKVMRLQNLALRAMPSSPAQKSIQAAAKKLQGNNPNWHPPSNP